jgi:hypothetical protein
VEGQGRCRSLLHVHKKEYKEKIGLREAQEKHRRWWLEKNGLDKALSELLSAKTACSFEMRRHLAKLFLILNGILALNGLRCIQCLWSCSRFASALCLSVRKWWTFAR